MSNRLENYLAQVAHNLRVLPASVREKELREMRAHLEQLAQDFQSQNRDADEAMELALAQFGGPRAVALGLRDAWEGTPRGWKPVAKTFLAAFAWCVFAYGALIVGGFSQAFWPQSALFPEIVGIVVALCVLAPLLTGAIFGARLGRRALMTGTLFLGVFTLLTRGNGAITYEEFSLPIWIWNFFWGFLGGAMTLWHRRRVRNLKWASGSEIGVVPILQPRKRNFQLATLGAFSLVFVGGGMRFQTVLHPHTPAEVVNYRLVAGRDSTRLQAPDPIVLHELQPTAKERAAGVLRVEYQIRAHMTPEYQARRVAFLKTQLASPLTRKQWGEKSLRASLARVQTNDFPISGVARLQKTPKGWQIEEKSFDWSAMHAWCENIYFGD